jgi:peptidyl-prolyl cis-trans isomerase C
MRRSFDEPNILRARPPKLTIKWSFQPKLHLARFDTPSSMIAKWACSQSKKRPENGSGRNDEGQIRGGNSDVNVAVPRIGSPNFAAIGREWQRLASPAWRVPMRLPDPFRRFLACGLVLGVVTLQPVFAQDETVVATIDGTPVTVGDLELAENDLDPQFAQLTPEQRRAAALSAIIEIRLLAASAEADGLADNEDFKRRLDFLRLRALHSAFVEAKVAAQVTDAAVRARYDTEVAGATPVNEIRARHILVATKEEAEAIIADLEAGGDFEAIAKEKSTDGAASQGGDLGFFGPGQMVPDFETAAFAIDVGAHSKEPVQTQFGFHVIKVEDKRAQQPPAFEQVRDQIRSVLLREIYFASVKELRDGAAIEIADPALAEAVGRLDRSE